MSNLFRPQLTIFQLKVGQDFVIKDSRGFTVWSVDENGTVSQKGGTIKL